ncbi:MAG: V-type ATPase subunit [Nitrospiraceae bacterium]|nr:MAG: V-type ATPase subunit [Nitrospiraceae bacterium]
MNLLQRPEGSGYPSEYLIARIAGRRGHLIRDWDVILYHSGPPESLLPEHYRGLLAEHSEEGVWKRMLIEYRWVYDQMNKSLIHTFIPFFIYSEIQTVVLCLRHKMEKEDRADVGNILLFSLLSNKIKDVLMKEAELPLILEELDRKLFSFPPKSGGLQETFLKRGLKETEEALYSGLFEHVIGSRLHPVIKSFFVFLIDIKNIISVYKQLRWEVETGQEFLEGGRINRTVLKKTLSDGKISDISRFVYQVAGISIQEPRGSEIRNALYSGLTRNIKSMSRESSDIGLILNYLWTIQMEAQNLSIIFYGRDIERDNLKKEIVIT